MNAKDKPTLAQCDPELSSAPMPAPEQAPASSASTGKRLLWLLVCVALGSVVGAVGSALTGDTRWYLAIPAAIAVGWLFLADPSQCDPSAGCGRRH